MMFQIWYMRPEQFKKGIWGESDNVDPRNLLKTHMLVDLMEGDKDTIYSKMQGENIARLTATRIKFSGLSHTSMSMGDVLVEHKEAGGGTAWLCDRVGWQDLGDTTTL